jgi:hypothetical protein
MIATTGSQATLVSFHPRVIRSSYKRLATGAQLVKARRKIATLEEAQSLSEQSCAPSRPVIRIADTLHRIGLTIIAMSIIDNINDFVVDSRNLPKPHWLSSFGWVAPYSLWAGVLLVFAGIVVRDRSWGRKRLGSDQADPLAGIITDCGQHVLAGSARRDSNNALSGHCSDVVARRNRSGIENTPK